MGGGEEVRKWDQGCDKREYAGGDPSRKCLRPRLRERMTREQDACVFGQWEQSIQRQAPGLERRV